MILARAASVMVGGLILVSVIAVAPGQADFDILNGEIVTTTQQLGDNGTGIVEQGGEIKITGGSGDAIDAGNQNTIINEGTISVTGFGVAIDADNQNTITNHGIIIVGGDEAMTALSIGESNTLTNTGTIEISTLDSDVILLFKGSNTIINSGTIIGASGAMSVVFDDISENGGHTIINSGWVEGEMIYYGKGGKATIINSGVMKAASNVI
jgi:hypothetical protein